MVATFSDGKQCWVEHSKGQQRFVELADLTFATLNNLIDKILMTLLVLFTQKNTKIPNFLSV